MRCNIIRVYLQVQEIQISQLFINCASSCFLNAVVHATGHISSSCSCSGAPLSLSHCAVGLQDFVAMKMRCRIAAFVTGRLQRLLSKASDSERPWGSLLYSTRWTPELLRLSQAGCSDCCRKPVTLSVHGAASYIRPGGFQEYGGFTNDWLSCKIYYTCKTCRIYKLQGN